MDRAQAVWSCKHIHRHLKLVVFSSYFFVLLWNVVLPVYCVFATIDIPAAGGGPLGVFPIAMSVMVSHLFLIPIDGCSINPSRSFGPSLVAAMAGIPGRYYHQQYMFWFGPMIGAAIAALIYGTSTWHSPPYRCRCFYLDAAPPSP